MSEKMLKHLEFLQGAMLRMGSNSFFVKGWSITLVSALFVLTINEPSGIYVLISYLVVPVFWILDGFFIATERQYRALYDKVRLKNEEDIDFNMDTSEFNKGKNTWLRGIFSTTLILFYSVLLSSTLIVTLLLKGCLYE